MSLCLLQLFNGALSSSLLDHITTEKMNHHTAVLFNGALSSSLLDQITTEKINHHTAVLFNGALSARSVG